jgi:glucose-6-phosphate-specific signal transduction histidine kinase
MKKTELLSVSSESLLSSLNIQGWSLKSFAEEIYENTGQLISLAKIQLATINPDKKDETKHIIQSSDQLLNRVIKNLRNLAKQLTPADIIRKGFLSSLKHELDRMNGLELWKIDFYISGKPFRTDDLKEFILFSIIQHYILQSLYVGNIKHLEVEVNFSENLIRISLTYPVNTELLTAKRGKRNAGVLERASHIGAIVSTKRKNNKKEISICLKK